MKRIYHPYYNWEEIKYNMWDNVSNRELYLNKAIKFTSDHKLYGKYMMKVIHEWHISCENALTDDTINQKAWVGHAACALAFRCPEDIVRQAWGKLTDVQKLLANEEARKAIRTWKLNYVKDKKLYKNMGKEMLL